MKYNKIFRILAIAIIIALLIIAIPATPALAQSITLTPTSGTPGTTVNVTGTGFTAYAGTYVYIYFSTTYGSPALVAAAGGLTASFQVPTTTPIGTYPITVQTAPTYNPANQIGAPASFTVTVPTITISPVTGGIGETVTVYGTGFAASSNATIYFDTEQVTTTITNTVGSFSGATFTTPESSGGTHTIKVQDSSANFDTASFTTTHAMTIDPTSGVIGSAVTVNGNGFKANSTIAITFNNITVITNPATVTTSSKGSFTASFNTPFVANGTYAVTVSDGTYSSSANFTAQSSAKLDTTTGDVGTEIIMSGRGFTPNATVNITYDGESITTTTALADSTFSVSFSAPPSSHGNHTITASDGINSIATTFTMESTKPPTPELLLPEKDTKLKDELFDWEDVEDPSGVTYNFQIASDEDFENIILEKEGLTATEYTLTEEEELESTKKEEPYYWRVKAIDGAFNESAWSEPIPFQVGMLFPELPLGAIIGITAGGFMALGLWLGRRTAYRYY